MKRAMYACAVLAAVMLLAAGCSKSEPPAEEAVEAGDTPAGIIEIDEQVLAGIRAYAAEGRLDPLFGYDQEGNQVEYPGVTFLVGSDEQASEATRAVEKLGAELSGTGYEVFIADMAYGMGMDRVAVLRTNDRFGILDVMQTGGYNYDIFPADVQAKLRDWDARFGIYIMGANADWVYLRLTSLPLDLDAFAEEVYAFCPDIVEQGTGSANALAKDISETHSLFLWWD